MAKKFNHLGDNAVMVAFAQTLFPLYLYIPVTYIYPLYGSQCFSLD